MGGIAGAHGHQGVAKRRGDGDCSYRYATLNEEHAIGKVIDCVPVADLLIDGRSTDNTKEIAVEKGAQLILEERQGKGSAIQTAFKSITADYAIMVDGDDTYPIEMATEMTRAPDTRRHHLITTQGHHRAGSLDHAQRRGERPSVAPRAGAVWCTHQ